MANGIIGISPEGRTIITYAGKTFYTADQSVIAMAAKGNVEGAARRWLGKTSAARELRKINKQSAKSLVKNVGELLFKRTFKEGKNKIGTSAQERAQFVSEYRLISKQVTGYIENAVADKVDLTDKLDRLPNDLQQRIKSIISTEVEKAYAAKGTIEDSDIELIHGQVISVMDDYLIETGADISPQVVEEIQDYVGNMETMEFEFLGEY